jgi:Big-like domain-containing protein
MKLRYITGLILLLAVSTFAGCGGSDNGGAAVDPNAPAVVTLNASKSLALANNSDQVTIRADVSKADGGAVADGTAVTFSAPENSCSLSAATAVTANGSVSVTLTRAPIQGAGKQTVTVTAAAGGASGGKEVKFINQPASAEVSVSFSPTVTNLAALNFTLNNTAGASFNIATQPVAAVNTASGSLVLGNFNAASGSTNFALVKAAGFNTGALPIIKATFDIAANAGLPAFSIDPAGFTATDPTSGPTAPAVTAANMIVTVTYDTER